MANSGYDVLTINDSQFNGSENYWITQYGIVVGRLGADYAVGFSDWNYEAPEQVVVKSGDGDGTFRVEAVDPFPMTLLGIPDLLIEAGGGADVLDLVDSANASAVSYSVSSTGLGAGAVTTSFGFQATFTGMETANLYRSVTPGTSVEVTNYTPAHYDLNVHPGFPSGFRKDVDDEAPMGAPTAPPPIDEAIFPTLRDGEIEYSATAMFDLQLDTWNDEGSVESLHVSR
jgi:hypothetical protein